MERDELARPSLHRHRPLPDVVHFPPSIPGYPSLHRRLASPSSGRLRFRVLALALARLVVEVDSSKGRALRLRWLRSLLGRDRRPLRREAPVEEASRLRQLSPPASVCVPPGLCLLPVSRCLIFFLSLENGSRMSMSMWDDVDGGAIADRLPRGSDSWRRPFRYHIGARDSPRASSRFPLSPAVSFSPSPFRFQANASRMHHSIFPFRVNLSPISVLNISCLHCRLFAA
jgi:hypothetical protein